MVVRFVALALGTGLLALACTQGPDGTGGDYQPLVFPWEGQLGASGASWGSTTAIVLDSNYADPYEQYEQYDLHKDRVTVALVNGTTRASANVRAVFPIQAPVHSVLSTSRPGATVTAVLLDLPNTASFGSPTSFPIMAGLEISIDGTATQTPQFSITGNQGSPNPLIDSMFASATYVNEQLDFQPLIRLRGKRGANKFNSSWGAIGGVEFDVRYKTACITDLDVYPASEAVHATAMVGSPSAIVSGYRTRHVTLLDPDGIYLVYLMQGTSPPAALVDETLAGTGPFIDLAATLAAGGSCDIGALAENNFYIENLRIAHVTGSTLLQVTGNVPLDSDAAPSSATDVIFRVYGVDKPPPPAPPPGPGPC